MDKTIKIWTNDNKDYIISVLNDKISLALFSGDGQIHIGTKFLSLKDALLLSEQITFAVTGFSFGEGGE